MSWLNFRSPLGPHPFIAALNSERKLKDRFDYRSGISQLDNLLAETHSCLSDFPYIYRREDVDFDALLAECPPLEAFFRLPGAVIGRAIVLSYIIGNKCHSNDRAYNYPFFRDKLYYKLFRAAIMADEVCLSSEDLKVFLLDVFPAFHTQLSGQVSIAYDSPVFQYIISRSLDWKTRRMMRDVLPEMASRIKQNGDYLPEAGLSLIPPDSYNFLVWLCEQAGVYPRAIPALEQQENELRPFEERTRQIVAPLHPLLREVFAGKGLSILAATERAAELSPRERAAFLHDYFYLIYLSRTPPLKDQPLLRKYGVNCIRSCMGDYSSYYYDTRLFRRKQDYTRRQALDIVGYLQSVGYCTPHKNMGKSLVRALSREDVTRVLDLVKDWQRQGNYVYCADEFMAILAARMPEENAAARMALQKAEEKRRKLADEMRKAGPYWRLLEARGRDALPQQTPIWDTPHDGQLYAHAIDLNIWLMELEDAYDEGADISFHLSALRALLALGKDNVKRLRNGEGELRREAIWLINEEQRKIVEDLFVTNQEKYERRLGYAKIFHLKKYWTDNKIPDGCNVSPFALEFPHEVLADADERLVLSLEKRIVRLENPLPFELREALSAPRSAARPGKAWLKKASAIMNEDNKALVLERLRLETGWLPECGRRRPKDDLFLCGFVWATHFLPVEQVLPVIYGLASQCFRKDPESGGILNEKLGNACVWVLENMADGAGAPALARLLSAVRYPKVKARINKALDNAAAARGISRDELDDLAAPDHGMSSGERRIPIGPGAAIIRMKGAKPVLSWENGKGRETKAPPGVLRENHAEEVKAARALVKEISKDLATHRQRLEGFYLKDRILPFERWRACYADHGTMALLARRLLWSAVWPDGRTRTILPTAAGMEDVSGQPVDCPGASISLWHPLMAGPGEIAAWRARLKALGIIQPFRQVWRETYELTAAERHTATYSNRFAAHIMRQHQFINLARINGWRAAHRMWVDAPNDEPVRIHIPAHELYAEFWVEGAGGEDDPPVLDSGAYIYVASDRLKFCRLDENAQWGRGEDVPLEAVPPIVFSEIMRHCDLFTSVASIGTDAQWMDRGRDANHPSQWDDYWSNAHEADLSALATNRREVLAALLPSLKDAGAFTLEERHLRVRGKRNEYLVHLGSGGVLLLPGKKHVCIVAKQGARPPQLPYEGDDMLALILSKALLLAHDDRIRDEVILRQIT